MRTIFHILTIFLILTSCSDQIQTTSGLKDEFTSVDQILDHSPLPFSRYMEIPTVMAGLQKQQALDAEIASLNSHLPTWYTPGVTLIVDRKAYDFELTPPTVGDALGISRGWPGDEPSNDTSPPPNNPGLANFTADAHDWTMRVIRSTSDMMKTTDDLGKLGRDALENEKKQQAESEAARAQNSELARQQSEFSNKLKQDQQNLLGALQADAAMRNQELLTSTLIASMIAAPIEQNKKLSDDLAQSKKKAEDLLSQNIQKGNLDSNKNARDALDSEFDRASQEFKNIADSIASNASGSTPPSSERNEKFRSNPYSRQGQAVRDAEVFLNKAREKVAKAPSGQGKQVAEEYLKMGDENLQISDEGYANGDSTLGDFALELSYALGDAAVSLAPLAVALAAPQAVVLIGVATVASMTRDYYELRTGRKLFSGRELTTFERSMNLASFMASFPIGRAAIATVQGVTPRLEHFLRVLGGGKSDLQLSAESIEQAMRVSDILRAEKHVARKLTDLAVTAKQLASLGFKGDVAQVLSSVKGWKIVDGNYDSVVHVIMGEFHGSKLKGGLHTWDGLLAFFKKTPGLEALTKVEVLPNGVTRVALPTDWLTKGISKEVEGVLGGKTLFPESWSSQKIVDSVNEIVSTTRLRAGPQIVEDVIDGVRIRVVLQDGLIKTAFPTWIQGAL